jgi:hypothetical protein
MIDLREDHLRFGDKDERIIKWEVWFQTPVGLTQNLPEAREICQKLDLIPEMAIVPVPVAISQTYHEVWAR